MTVHALAAGNRTLCTAVVAAAVLILGGCASGRPAPDATTSRADASGERIAEVALSLRGSPYRYGGDGPDAFDCSGLVQYSYRQAGFDVPRTTDAQYDAVDRVYLSQLQPGDVLFFRIDGMGVQHVGVYVGDQRFVHAPKTGTPVHMSSLAQRYWRRRVIRAGSLAE